MNWFCKKFWLSWSKVRFLMLPYERRVSLEIGMDGRHLPYLLTTLGEAGYGVHVVGAPFVFRELMLLIKSVPIPFVVGGKERECAMEISDRQGEWRVKSGELHEGESKAGGHVKRIVLDYNYFSGLRAEFGQNGVFSPSTTPKALRMPYFMHPSVYHRGLHKSREHGGGSMKRSTLDSAAKRRRRFRIGFFGTHDREFYTKHYHFPGMNRFEILEVFLEKFGDRITRLCGFPKDWDPCEMAVSIDSQGGDRREKSFLSQEHYFAALQECDFVLSPPGWCMPVSHNLIEAMFCGAIPITNGAAFMAEPLRDGETYLEFQDAEELFSVIHRALAMDDGEVAKMRGFVREYYDRFLEPRAFAKELSQSDDGRVFVNAEEHSIPLVIQRGFSRKGLS